MNVKISDAVLLKANSKIVPMALEEVLAIDLKKLKINGRFQTYRICVSGSPNITSESPVLYPILEKNFLGKIILSFETWTKISKKPFTICFKDPKETENTGNIDQNRQKELYLRRKNLPIE